MANLKNTGELSRTKFENVIFYHQWGEYYKLLKNYNNAIENYKSSLRYAKEIDDIEGVLDAYEGIVTSYKVWGKEEEGKNFFIEYAKIKTEKQKADEENTQTTVSFILKNEEQKSKNTISTYKNTFISILIVICLAAIYFRYRMTKTLNEKKKIDKILFLKEFENQELQQKLSNHSNELIDLAKLEPSIFWARFQEIHPHFIGKMLAINAKLTTAELNLSAYLYLGFSTKEISTYSFRSPKTIETTRYNLRKKLDLPSEENFFVWLRNYIDN